MKSRNGLGAWLLSTVLAIAACGGSSGGKTDGGPTGGAGSGGAAGGAAGGTTGNGGTGGGAAGQSGTAGSGTSGTTGAAGASGTSGAAGRGGTTGTAGTGSGTAGRGGTTGSAGTSGAAGQSGTAGTIGAGGGGGLVSCLSTLKVTQVAANSLTDPLTAPTFLTGAPGTTDLFVTGQGGKVYLLKNGAGPAKVFLDITTKVKPDAEDGLLGLAFHPGYATNGRFFVDIVTNTSPLTVAVAEYARSTANADLADTTEKRRQTIAGKDGPNGSGGMLVFGPDGYLYAGLGVGTTLLTMAGAQLMGPGNYPVHGAIIRLDVSTAIAYAPGGGTYPSPMWANGLREPWRFTFDRGTNDLYIGDVGDDTREEVDYEAFTGRVGGRNYGYRDFEGTYCAGQPNGTYNANCTATAPSYVFPIYDYPHANGDACVIGGYVYHGKNIPCLTGTYLFGDYATSIVRALVVKNGALSGTVQVVPDVSYAGKGAPLKGLTAFGEDANGELYLVHAADAGAAIYRIDSK